MCRSIARPPSTRRRSTTSIAATSRPGTSRSSAGCRSTRRSTSPTSAPRASAATPALDINAPLTLGGGDASRPYCVARPHRRRSTPGAQRLKTEYKSLQVALNKPFTHGLMFKGAYTLSKAMNESDNDGRATLTWNTPSELWRNWAPAGFDRRHNFQLGFAYALPWQSNGGYDSVAKAILGDWQLNGVVGGVQRHAVHGDGQRHVAQHAEQRSRTPTSSATSTCSATSATPARGSTRRRSRSRPASASATPAATSSTVRAAGTSTSRCSARSRGRPAAARSPLRGGTTSSITRSSPTRDATFTSGTFGQITGINGNGSYLGTPVPGGTAVHVLSLDDPRRASARRRIISGAIPWRAHVPSAGHILLLTIALATPARHGDPAVAVSVRAAAAGAAGTSLPRLALDTFPAGRARRDLARASRRDRAHPRRCRRRRARSAGCCTPGSSGTPRTRPTRGRRRSRRATFDWPYLDAVVLQRLARHADAAARSGGRSRSRRTICRRG